MLTVMPSLFVFRKLNQPLTFSPRLSGGIGSWARRPPRRMALSTRIDLRAVVAQQLRRERAAATQEKSRMRTRRGQARAPGEEYD